MTIKTNEPQVLNEFLGKRPHVSFMRLQWQDYSGVVRGLVYLSESVLAMVAEGKPFKAGGPAMNYTVDSGILPTTPHDGIHFLIPDWSSLRQSSDPQMATVMCASEYTRPGTPVHSDLCPRRSLLKMLNRAEDAWNLKFLVGFEVEFLVMKTCPTTGRIVPHSRGLGHFAVSSLRDPCFRYVEQCFHHLRDQGVALIEVHAEGHRGQYEIVLGPLPPIQAIDQLIFVHDTLKNVFSRHGYVVTMAPKPVTDWEVNGQHMHLSLQPASPVLENHFLAGILKRLPGLCAFAMPQILSYERLQPYLAGVAVCWGTQSRVVPIRRIKPSHWEIRCIDATANMYSTLTVIIAAGLLGLEKKEPLVWPDLGLPHNKGLPQGEPLPKSLEDALSGLESDLDSSSLATMVSHSMIDHHVEMKRFEISRLKDMDTQTVRELLVENF